MIDRDYFQAIYFRTFDEILFEVATNQAEFDRDEAPADLGQTLKLPARHERLRGRLERHLSEIGHWDDIRRKMDRRPRPAAGVDLSPHRRLGRSVPRRGLPDSHIVSPSGAVSENGGRRFFARRLKVSTTRKTSPPAATRCSIRRCRESADRSGRGDRHRILE